MSHTPRRVRRALAAHGKTRTIPTAHVSLGARIDALLKTVRENNARTGASSDDVPGEISPESLALHARIQKLVARATPITPHTDNNDSNDE